MIVFSFVLMGTNTVSAKAVTKASSGSATASRSAPVSSGSSVGSVAPVTPVSPGGSMISFIHSDYNPDVDVQTYFHTSGSYEGVTTTTATLKGSTNPGGENVTATYLDQSGNILPGGGVSMIPVNYQVNVPSLHLTGLTPNTHYTYRLVVSDGPHSDSVTISFTTLSNTTPDFHVLLSASDITTTTATLNGSTNPGGENVTATYLDQSGNILQGYSLAPLNSQIDVQSYHLTGLTPNTSYTYKLVVSDGPHTNTKTVSFNTLPTVIINGGGHGGGGSGSYTPVVIAGTTGFITTVQATSQLSTSAKLNGIFINSNNASAQGYFEYGATSAMNSTTAENSLGTNTSVSFSKTVTGLAPNTIYYFRAVAVKGGTVYKGRILVFKTKVEAPVNKKTTPVKEVTPTEPEVVTTQSQILSITTSKDKITTGDKVEYVVIFKNNNKSNLENVKVVVQLPTEINFEKSNFGDMGNDNAVTLDSGILAPSEVRSMTIDGTVNSKAENQSVLVTTAVMTYNIAGSTTEKSEIAYVSNHIVLTGVSNVANPLFGANFMPTSLIGWIILLLLIALLVIIVRKIYLSYSLKKNKTLSADHIDNLPM